MDILFITYDFPPNSGGIAKVISSWARYLSENYQVGVLTNIRNNDAWDGWQPYLIWRARFPSVYLLWILITLRPKKIIAGEVLPSGWLALLFASSFGYKYYVASHGNEVVIINSGIRERLGFQIKKIILNNATKIFCCSHFTSSLLVGYGLAKTKIKVIYGGADPNPVANEPTTELLQKKYGLSGKRIILTVGRLVQRKNQASVIRALPEVLKRYPGVHYLIVGSGPMEKNLRQIVRRMHLTGDVTLLHAADSELPSIYSLAEIFIMVPFQPSEDAKDVEGLGIVFLEAASFALPTIGSDFGGVAEAVDNDKTGLLVTKPTNSKEISQKIVKLLADRKLAKRLGSAGRKRIQKELNWELQVNKLADELFK